MVMDFFNLTADEKYAGLLSEILTGIGLARTRNADCYRQFGLRYKFDKTPLVGLRKTAWKTALREWEWFMSGSSFIYDLHESARPWWQPWANQAGFVPFNYSEQFRNAKGRDLGHYADQVENMVNGVRNHPHGRRNILVTWNAADMTHRECPITNCHNTVTQAFVDDANAVHLLTYQRSADAVVGLPANWVQEWAFLLWLAHKTGRRVGTLDWIGGDCHVYAEHESLARHIVLASSGSTVPMPNLVYTPTSPDFKAGDFTLDGPYEPVITEKARMIV